MYKRIFSNPQTRQKILKFFDFVPDRLMIYFQYFASHARFLNLEEPVRFTEKIQAYKLWHKDDLMTICADKYRVREYVKEKDLSDILIPIIDVYDHASDIDFDLLPQQFVLKTNNGSHTNIICKNKSDLDVESSRKALAGWVSNWQGKMGREWAYYNITPKIIAEEYLHPDSAGDLVDYKFFCFSGEPYCLYVIARRFFESGPVLGIFDCDFNQMPYFRADMNPLVEAWRKPDNFSEMLRIARILSTPFPHARVDLYNVDGKIYFGEITFYDGSGYRTFYPDEFDRILGKKFQHKMFRS